MQTSSTVPDSELYSRSRHGDRAAFGTLVERHKDGLVNYLTRLCGDREEAEDLAQEAFLRLYERSDRYREQGHLRAYLFRIATNLFRTQKRREQRWSRLRLLFFNTNGHHTDAAQQIRLLQGELSRQLAAALLAVPIRYRVPVLLALVEGWSHREIADLLECREGTVKSRIHRGRRQLQTLLDGYTNGDAP